MIKLSIYKCYSATFSDKAGMEKDVCDVIVLNEMDLFKENLLKLEAQLRANLLIVFKTNLSSEIESVNTFEAAVSFA